MCLLPIPFRHKGKRDQLNKEPITVHLIREVIFKTVTVL